MALLVEALHLQHRLRQSGFANAPIRQPVMAYVLENDPAMQRCLRNSGRRGGAEHCGGRINETRIALVRNCADILFRDNSMISLNSRRPMTRPEGLLGELRMMSFVFG